MSFIKNLKDREWQQDNFINKRPFIFTDSWDLLTTVIEDKKITRSWNLVLSSMRTHFNTQYFSNWDLMKRTNEVDNYLSCEMLNYSNYASNFHRLFFDVWPCVLFRKQYLLALSFFLETLDLGKKVLDWCKVLD